MRFLCLSAQSTCSHHLVVNIGHITILDVDVFTITCSRVSCAALACLECCKQYIFKCFLRNFNNAVNVFKRCPPNLKHLLSRVTYCRFLKPRTITAFCACRRFSRFVKHHDCGPSITSSVTHSRGKQEAVRESKCLSAWENSSLLLIVWKYFIFFFSSVMLKPKCRHKPHLRLLSLLAGRTLE